MCNCDTKKIATKTPPQSTSCISENDLKDLKIRVVQKSKAKTSPKILVTHNGNKFPLLVDEGSELDAIDGDYAVKNKIEVEPSSKSAKAARNKDLCVLGQSKNEVYVDTKFGSIRVSLNLGKAVIIKNLGATMILGEPGKCRNGISTNARERLVYLEREGGKLKKGYFDHTATSTICKITENKVTIFPDHSVTLAVPEHLQNSDVLITPRRPYGDLFHHKIAHVGETVQLESASIFPINLTKHDQVADIRRVSPLDPDQEVHHEHDEEEQAHVNRLIPHDGDCFKFEPTAIKVDPPDISKIKIDPQNQLSPSSHQRLAVILEDSAMWTPPSTSQNLQSRQERSLSPTTTTR